MYKYAISFMVLAVAMGIVAEIAFRWEMKKYQKELERRNKSEKDNTVVSGGSSGE